MNKKFSYIFLILFIFVQLNWFVVAKAGTFPAIISNSSSGILLDPVYKKIYLFRDTKSITVIDSESLKLLDIIQLPDFPKRIKINKTLNKLYVLNNSGFIDVVDLNKNKYLKTIKLDNPIDRFIVDGSGRNLIYAIHDDINEISIIDSQNDSPLGLFGVGIPGTDIVLGLPTNGTFLLDEVRNKIYIAIEDDKVLPIEIGALSAIDCLINGALQLLTDGLLGSNCGILGTVINVEQGATKLFFNPTTNILYTQTDDGCGNVSVISGSSNNIISTIPISGCSSLQEINIPTNTLYVGSTHKVLGTNSLIEIYVGGDIIASDPKDPVLYVRPDVGPDFIYQVLESSLNGGMPTLPIINEKSFVPKDVTLNTINNFATALKLLERDSKARKDTNRKYRSLLKVLKRSLDNPGTRCSKDITTAMKKLQKMNQEILKQNCSFTVSGVGDVISGIQDIQDQFGDILNMGFNRDFNDEGLPDIGQGTSKQCIPNDIAFTYSNLINSYIDALVVSTTDADICKSSN